MIDYLHARGWLVNEERQLLHEAAAQIDAAGLIVNIGVEYGASLACLRSGNPTATLIGIDLDNSKNEANAQAELMTGDSGVIGADWARPIDLLFIDGDHSHAGVRRDTAFCRAVKSGGIILFHDCFACNNPTQTPHVVCAEINQAIDEWLNCHPGEYHEQAPVKSIRRFIKA